MNPSTHQTTKLWLLPQFDNLELFRAKAIHYHYARHFHSNYSIGIIEAGVGGNHYQGSTYLAPPKSIVLMNQQVLCLHTALEQPQEQLAQQTMFVQVLSAILSRYANIKIDSVQGRQEHQAVQLMKDYLHDHFRANISLEQLAEITNLNRSYLIRVFHKAVGMPPYTYLNQIRVEKVKHFLVQGMSIAETAIAVGMADQSHLNRHFKRIVGIPPGQYRNMSTSFKTG